MRHVLSDLRISLKLLARHPGHALVSVLVLALGIGASTSVYSLVRGVVLRPLPFPEFHRLLDLREVEDGALRNVSVPTYLDWGEGQQGLASLAVYLEDGRVVTEGGRARSIPVALVSRDFFHTLGIQPARGRWFVSEEHEAGRRSVVVSHGFWQSTLGADDEAVGGSLRMGDASYRIVGVAPAWLSFPGKSELWLPLLAEAPDFRSIRGARIFGAVGRLAGAASMADVEATLSRITADGAGSAAWSARIRPLRDAMVGDARQPLFMLLGAVLFVLLVACANVANLSLARTFAREREIGIRRALGAGRGRIASLVMGESALVALAACGLGVLLAGWGLDAMLAVTPRDLPRSDEAAVDGPVLVFAVLLSAASAVAAGAAPALRSRGMGVAHTLKDGGTAIASPMGARRLRNGIVVAEVALTVLLLAGAGLLTRSFVRILSVDPGIEPRNVLTFGVQLPSYRYERPGEWQRFFDELTAGLERRPEIGSVALTRNLPFSGTSMTSPVEVEGAPAPSTEEGPGYVQVVTVGPAYFRTMGTRIIEGRSFSSDDGPDGAPVAMVNQAFAETFLSGESPVGRRARSFFGNQGMREVVGVVANVHHGGLTGSAPPTFYVPAGQDPERAFTVVVRSSAPAASVFAAARDVLASLDPEVPMSSATTMDALLGRSVAEPRFYMVGLCTFGALALLLAAVGLYGVVGTSVASRYREMGIRFAIGADRSEVTRLVLGEAFTLTGLGVALGLVGAVGLGRVLEGILFGIGPGDPGALAAGVLLTMAAALAAAWLPARRAARVNPVDVLRP